MRGITAVFLLLLFACSDRPATPRPEERVPVRPSKTPVTPPAPTAPVRTDRTSYVLVTGRMGAEATIISTLRAPADTTLYIVNCNGAFGTGLQRRVGERWVDAWANTINQCLSEPIVVPPGGEHTASILLHEHSGGVIHPPRARMIESGTYRVVWTGVLTSFDSSARGFGPELPLEQRVSAPITIEVPPLVELTAEETERLVTMLAEAINDPASDTTALEPYILHGREALRAALPQYRIALGRVTKVRRIKELIFEMKGTNGSSLVEGHREDRARIHSTLLDYGFRGERFMEVYLEAIAKGDAERLARVLSPDDIDFPVPRARELIATYRKRYSDVASIRAEFAGVDDSRSLLLWRFRGPGAGGREVQEPIELLCGDGLIGLRMPEE